MKNIFLLLIIACACCSCATITNFRRDAVSVYTNVPAKVVLENDTFQTEKNRIWLYPLRSREPMKLLVLTESSRKELSIPASNSSAYIMNFANYGIGYLLERKSPKRYSYPTVINVDPGAKENHFLHFQKPGQGNLLMHLSLPHFNIFQLSPDQESTKSNAGFFGIGAGFDYYYRENRFLSLSGAAVADIFIPVPAVVDFSGPRELMTSLYLSASHNHRIKRYAFGYGLSLSRNTWDYQYHHRFDPPAPVREPVTRTNTALGLVFPAYYQIGSAFNVGVIYRPTFLRFNAIKSFRYEHLFSLDLAWKIRLF